MERLVRDQIMAHLLEHLLLADEQHGFVPRSSCTTNLLESAELLTKELADQTPVDVLYLDFSRGIRHGPTPSTSRQARSIRHRWKFLPDISN